LKHQTATEGIAECEIDGGSLMPQVLLFIAQLVAGIGHSLLSTLGISYMDE
jgi:Organic Anion Transporter Polypeptide (OATP) family